MAAPGQLPQQYCLRWNNHQHNLLSVFEDLLNSEAFVDVTLACDGLQLKAHKMVLSACSPYFQSMLYNTPDRHPIVFLRDVRYAEMKALLEFMYRGEVSVDQENLSSLLKVAEGLKIKGLAEVNDNGPSPPTSSHSKFPLLSPLDTHGGGSPAKRMPSPPNPAPPVATQSSQPSSNNSGALGPKRKRARPRRFSGSEAVPMAGGFSHLTGPRLDQPLEVQTEDMSEGVKADKGLREGNNGDASPEDAKALDLMSEADSNDGRSSGMLTPKKELWPAVDNSSNHHTPGVSQVSCEPDVKHLLAVPSDPQCSPSGSNSTNRNQAAYQRDLNLKLSPTTHSKDGRKHSNLAIFLVDQTSQKTSNRSPHQNSTELLKIDTQNPLIQTELNPLVMDEDELSIGVSDQGEDTFGTNEYIIFPDGSCQCKICGENLASRTHWYRHKYKVHNVSLFRCDKCEVYFKSKKGYEGHVTNRHTPKLVGSDGKPKSKKEVQGLNKVLKEIQSKKEAELVQKIIAQVKAECEASGSDLERRGYMKHTHTSWSQ
ncbi:protein tramtrack, beta isoform-like isoform X3 [Tigriopus californicus]|uniref:protein tramtrack, beta isoform-like isoform X3 n=1 Tax=Tigriopus californicus TaxID=6832 RepID=UPI0027DA1F92|nr:protein tramtrack, beta isoform-like isoform X3 [Tigriopus californicus]